MQTAHQRIWSRDPFMHHTVGIVPLQPADDDNDDDGDDDDDDDDDDVQYVCIQCESKK